MNWISVKDQLPSRYTEVLIFPRPENNGIQYTGEYGLLKGHSEPVWYYSYYEGGWGWESAVTEVTHWMPIPENPK